MEEKDPRNQKDQKEKRAYMCLYKDKEGRERERRERITILSLFSHSPSSWSVKIKHAKLVLEKVS